MTGLGLPSLRPLSVGQLLDRAFRLYRKNFAVFIGIVALTQIPLALLNILINFSTSRTALQGVESGLPTPAVSGPNVLLNLVVFLLASLLTQIGIAALTRAVGDDYLNKPVTLRGTFSRIKDDWLRLVGTSILLNLVIMGVAIPLVIVLFIPVLGAIIAIIGFVAIGFVAGTITYLIPCVVVLEKDGGRSALRRAWHLVSLRYWRVLGYIFLLVILNYLIVLGPAALLALFIETVQADLFVAAVSQQVAQLVLTAVFTPLQFTAVTLMYFDLRIRFEGFDLMVLAAGGDDSDSGDLDKIMKTV